MSTLIWSPSEDSPLPTGYFIERSIDNGINWTTVTTIAHVLPGPNYDTELGQFTFVDTGTLAGEIIRIQAVDSGDSSRDSNFQYKHATPDLPQTVHLYGVVVDTVTGEVRQGLEVRICPLAQLSGTFIPSEGSQATVPAVTPESLQGMKRETILFTDTDGAWNIDILTDIAVRVEIPAVRYQMSFRTPKDRDVLNINDAYIYRIGGGEGVQAPYEYGVGSGFVT